MAQGTVKWFSRERGYGFIVPDEGGEDLFVRHTGVSGEGFKTLDEGARVSYEGARGRKGMQAVNVRAVPAAGHQRARVNPGVEVGAPRKDVPVREEETPAFRTGDPVLFTDTHYLTGREATVLTVSPNEILVRASILRGKGVLYRGNAVLPIRRRAQRREAVASRRVRRPRQARGRGGRALVFEVAGRTACEAREKSDE